MTFPLRRSSYFQLRFDPLTNNSDFYDYRLVSLRQRPPRPRALLHHHPSACVRVRVRASYHSSTASRGQRSRLPELSRPLPRLDLTALRCHPEFPESSRSKKRETGRIGREQETKGELRFRQQVIITTEMKYVCQDLAEVDKLFGICAAPSPRIHCGE